MEYIKSFFQTNEIKRIINEKKNNTLLEGYLFYCEDLYTNKLFAKVFSLIILCDDNGCLECGNCLKILDEIHPDVLNYPIGKNFVVDDAKNLLEEVNKKPMVANKKIIIINNIDTANETAQNKILKILEEPPKNVIFVATATNLDNVLPTIKSRLGIRKIMPFTKKEVQKILSDEVSFENFDLAIQNGNGYLGLTLEILQNKDYKTLYQLAVEVVTKFKKSKEILFFSTRISQIKENFLDFLQLLAKMFEDLMYLKIGKQDLVVNQNELIDMNSVLNDYSLDAIVKIQEKLIITKTNFANNVNFNIMIDKMLFDILEVKYLCK